ncbi:MAG: C10 family peptidase [Candidatus Amulumruptor caecigallinarius]|nr:C10 family peptidase [Candidatus Amulumruptor caecigallinarius]
MKKKLTVAAAAIAVTASLSAATLSPEAALQRANANAPAKARALTAASMRLAHTQLSKSGAPAAYVFEKASGEGFAIIAADDIALPLLGYSDTQSFSIDNMPIQLKWLLGKYAEEIEYFKEHGATSADALKPYAPASWTSIEPLCKTTWNQDAPYNRLTPKVGSTQTPTGCVATSMAQAMNYFKYPDYGNAILRYTWNKQTLRLNLTKQPFEWDKMLDNYTNSSPTENIDAVAYLMQACGYSVEMNYGAESSGAMSYKIINALVNYFKYDASADYIDRNIYSPEQWAEIIYNNIKNVGPVIYDGSAIDGGHSFICDGYDGNGYFHFNWGWGGSSDGYYLLDVLNPESQGSGGAVGGFNYGQNAVINMQLPTGETPAPRYKNLIQYGNSAASLDGKKLVWTATDYGEGAGWGNPNFSEVSANVGIRISGIDGTNPMNVIKGGRNNPDAGPIELQLNTYYPVRNGSTLQFDLPSSLADGNYKVTLMTQDTQATDAPWQEIEIKYGYANYVWLKVEGGRYSVSAQPVAKITFEDVTLTDPVYYGHNAMLTAKLKNSTDLDLSQCIQPVLVKNGVQMFGGDMMLVSVNSGSEIEKEWVIRFYQLTNNSVEYDVPYTLQIIDVATKQVVGTFGQVVFKNMRSSLTIKVNDFSVVGASQKDVTIGTRTFKNTYIVDNRDDFTIKFDYSVTGGYFDNYMRIGVSWYDPETLSTSTVMESIYSGYPFLAQGEGDVLEIPMDMSKYSPNGVYTVRAFYVNNGVNKGMGNITFAFDTTGVEGIEMDAEDAQAEYYNLQGVKVDNPGKGLYIRVANGKAEKVMKK